MWGDWGTCTKCSGERLRFRHIIQHAEHGGQTCEPFTAEEAGACPRQCHEEQYCSWGHWGEWGACTAECGTGRRMRRRYLGLTTEPASPPPPVQEMVEMYMGLKEETMGLEAIHRHELVLAFCCGFSCFVMIAVGARVLLMRMHARLAEPCISSRAMQGQMPLSSRSRSRSDHDQNDGDFDETSMPLVGSAA
jgi:hypothetical protein